MAFTPASGPVACGRLRAKVVLGELRTMGEGMNALERIDELKRRMQVAQAEIAGIQAACDHDWQPSLKDRPDCSSAICVKCGAQGNGWWCEASPTKTCDYSTADGRGWNSDCCRYCGNPDERK